MTDVFQSGGPIGIVLVGTYCWNSSPFDALMPRALLPIAHRPLMSYALSWLREGGIRDVIVCGNRDTRALGPLLMRHGSPEMALSYQEDPVPRGTAGSIGDAASATHADTFVIAEGTAIPTVNLAELLARHHASRAVATVVVHCDPRTHGYPNLQLSTGIYVFDRRALDFIPRQGFCDIKENLLPALYQAGQRVTAYSVTEPTARVLSATTYLGVNGWMVERLVSSRTVPPDYARLRGCLFHRDATIAGDAVFVGAVLVGPGARIESGATIVGPSSIGRNATIGRGGVVSRSAIWRRCVLGDHASADRSILADAAVVQPRGRVHHTVLRAEARYADGPARPDREPSGTWRTVGVEFCRRFGRAIGYPDWSRSPAPQ
jgi:NDP-sugar pyrophosphorylase family protein